MGTIATQSLDLIAGKPRHAMALTGSLAAFGVPVVRVLAGSAKKPMLGSVAARCVAGVADGHSVRDGADEGFIAPPSCTVVRVAHRELPVSVLVGTADPGPAPIGIRSVNLGPVPSQSVRSIFDAPPALPADVVPVAPASGDSGRGAIVNGAVGHRGSVVDQKPEDD